MVLKELLDLIYPRICFSCKRHLSSKIEGYLCPSCLAKIDKPQPPFCIVCGKSIDILDLNKCPECTGYNYYFTRGYSATTYEGIIKDCLHSLKYNSHTYLAGTLAYIMIDFAIKYIDSDKIDAVIPVPLHWQRYRNRGFNQSEILARLLSKNIEVPFMRNGISRIKVIRPQVDLPRNERIKNVQGAFKVKNPRNFLGKHILLIDDVFTTGATLNECSNVLLESGAKEVWVFTLTRGV